MSDLNDNTKKFNLPSYINIPFFLYQDHRLEKSATLLAAFFYSLFTAGKSIKASTDYLCQLANIDKRQYYRIMNQLEEYKYIKRIGFTNRKKTHWIFIPQSCIIIVEKDTSVTDDTSVLDSNTSDMDDSKLVSSMSLNYCHPCHTDTKEDTKEVKKLTTNCESSSSFFFSEMLDRQMLAEKLDIDRRSDEEFLTAALNHVENHSEKTLPIAIRHRGILSLLRKQKKLNEIFYVKGTEPQETTQNSQPTHKETIAERDARYKAEYEKEKSRIFANEREPSRQVTKS